MPNIQIASDDELLGLTPPAGGNLGRSVGKPAASVDIASDEELLGWATSVKAQAAPSGNRLVQDAKHVLAQGAVGGAESIVGLADIASGGRAGKWFEENVTSFKDARAYWDEKAPLSEGGKAAKKAFDDADGPIDSAKAVVQNPSNALMAAGESLPGMLAGGAAARGIGLFPKLAKWAGAIGEGLMSAGSTAEQARQQNGDGLLTAGQTAIAGGSGALTAVLNRVGSKLAKKWGLDDVDDVIAGAASAETKQGLARRVVGGMVSEGLIEELPQSVQEQVAQNLATDRPMMEGVDKAAVMGVAAGGVMGGAANLRPHRAAQQPQPTADEQPQQQQGPTESQLLAGNAFVQAEGAPELVQRQRGAQALIAVSLDQMDAGDRVKAIEHLAAGNDELKEQLAAAAEDEGLLTEGRAAIKADVRPFVALNSAIREQSGVWVDSSTETPSAVDVAQSLQGQQPGLNSANFAPEPAAQINAQLEALRQGRIPAVVMGLQEAQTADFRGLPQPGIATGPDGQQAVVVASSDEAIQAVVTRAQEVGIQQALGEVKGYVDPTITSRPGTPSAVVQKVDDATGHVLHEEVVTPDQAGNVQHIPGTTTRVKSAEQALQERIAAHQAEAAQAPPPTAPQPGRSLKTKVSSFFGGKKATVEGADGKVTEKSQTLVKDINRSFGIQDDNAPEAIDPGSVLEVEPSFDKRLGQLAAAMKTAFGTEVVFVHTPKGSLTRLNGEASTSFNGVALRRGNRLYLNIEAANPLNTLGHELAHILEREHPDLYEKLEIAVISRLRHQRATQLFASLQEAVNREGGESELAQLLRQEVVAEGIGEMAEDPKLWREMFAQMGSEQEAKTFFQKVLEVLGQLAKAFTRAGYIQGVKDMQAVRKAVTETYLEWSRRYEASQKAAAAATTQAAAPAAEDKGQAAAQAPVAAPAVAPAVAPKAPEAPPAVTAKTEAPAPKPAPVSPMAQLKAETRRYGSGMSARGDLENSAAGAMGQALNGVGVVAGELSGPAIESLADATIAQRVAVFVDSGAFGAFRKTLQGKTAFIDFDKLLAKYDEILAAIDKANTAEETDYPRPLLVMPDVVGNQADSLRLIDHYKDWIKAELTGNLSRPIVPIQKGELSMADAYRKVVETLGTDNFIVGVPSNEEAVTPAELEDFLRDARPRAIHVLGAASDKKLEPRLQSVINAGLVGQIIVTADASPVRSKLLAAVKKGEKRGDAAKRIFQNPADPANKEPSERTPQEEAGRQRAATHVEAKPAKAVEPAEPENIPGNDESPVGGRAIHQLPRELQEDPWESGDWGYDLFENPEGGTVRAEDAKSPVLNLKDAAKTREDWVKITRLQGKSSKNSGKVVLSLFDQSGNWALPWAEAGYDVITMDLRNGQDITSVNLMEHLEESGLLDGNVDVILAAVPCTDFANSGNRWKAEKLSKGQIDMSVNLVEHTKAMIEILKPMVWAIENPIGDIQKRGKLPDPRLRFHPHHYGDAYTKHTQIFGKFNPELPQANVFPDQGSKMHGLRGDSPAEKAERSKTPMGFAYAFFMANGGDITGTPVTIPKSIPSDISGEMVDATGTLPATVGIGEDREQLKARLKQQIAEIDAWLQDNRLKNGKAPGGKRKKDWDFQLAEKARYEELLRDVVPHHPERTDSLKQAEEAKQDDAIQLTGIHNDPAMQEKALHALQRYVKRTGDVVRVDAVQKSLKIEWIDAAALVDELIKNGDLVEKVPGSPAAGVELANPYAEPPAKAKAAKKKAPKAGAAAPADPNTQKVYKYRSDADKARKELGNVYRLQKVKDGYKLRLFTDKEREAARIAGLRLNAPGGLDVDKDSLLVAIAKLGGLRFSERADTIGEGNRSFGRGQSLFREKGRALDDMATALYEEKYIPEVEWQRDEGDTWLRDAMLAEWQGHREYFSERGDAAQGFDPSRLSDEEFDALRNEFEDEQERAAAEALLDAQLEAQSARDEETLVAFWLSVAEVEAQEERDAIEPDTDAEAAVRQGADEGPNARAAEAGGRGREEGDRDAPGPQEPSGVGFSRVTTTPAFKAWFGDSKVVDADGKPLVVYHGTNQEHDVFRQERLGTNTQASSALGGFFFTSSATEASDYADLAAKRMIPGAPAHEAKTERLMKAVDAAERIAQRTGKWEKYEALVLELEAHEYGAINDEPSGANVMPVYLSIQNPKVVTVGGAVSTGKVTKWIQEAKAAGKDGLVLRDITDGPKWMSGAQSDHYVAFRPEQIKSATGNNGNFDPADARINFSRLERTAIRDRSGAPLQVYHGGAANLDAFDFRRLGANAPNPSAHLGAWMTSSKQEAARYGDVQSAYLDIRNPKRIPVDRLPAFNTPEQAVNYRRMLQAQGHDGLIIDASHLGGQTNYVAFRPEQIVRFDIPEPEARELSAEELEGIQFQRNASKLMTAEEVLHFTQTAQLPHDLSDNLQRGAWADAYMNAKKPGEVKGLLKKLGDWYIEKAADSLIPVTRWVQSLPLGNNLKQRLDGDMHRAATLRGFMEKEVKEKYAANMYAAIEKAAKTSKLSTDKVKKMAGEWMTARYAPKANLHLINKDRAALLAAQQSGDPALIAEAQRNLQARIADVSRPVPQPGQTPPPFTRGVAGGMSDAVAAQIKANAEAHIDVALLQEIAQPVYDMLAWKKRKDLASGKVSQAMVNSWPNHPDYVPLTGDPRFDRDSTDVFSAGNQLNQDVDHAINGRKDSMADDGIDAAFTATVKSVNFAAMQDFKNTLAGAYREAQRLGLDIGLRAEPVTGINRMGDDVVIHRRVIQTPNGMERVESTAYTFADKAVIGALKRENMERLNSIIDVVSAPTRWYARLVTQAMPAFAPLNFVRDIWERSEFLRTRTLYAANGQVVNVKKAARASIVDSINPELWKASLAKNLGKGWTSAARGDLEEMLRLGGNSTWGEYLSRTSSDLEASIRRNTGMLAHAAHGAMKVLEVYNNSFELIPSLAIYRALKAQGMDPIDAASATLDMMNFRKKGTAMPVMRGLFVFAQPAAQSGYNLARALATPVGRKRFAAYAVLGSLLYAFLKGFWPDDDEIGNELDNLGNFTIERSIPVKMGGTLVKVPVGFGMPQLAWAGAAALNRWYAGRYTAGDALGEVAKSWVKSVAPVAPSDMEIHERPVDWLVQTITPTLARPLMNIYSDQTAFGAPLTPQFLDNKKMKYEQQKRTTAGFWGDVAQNIHEMTGIDMYPDHVKALADGYAVGPMREILQHYIENPARGERGEPARLIGISSIVDNINDRNILNSVYYRVRKDLDAVHREFKSREARDELEGWETPERREQAEAFEQFEHKEKELSRRRSQSRKTAKQDDPEWVRERTTQIEQDADEARREILKAYLGGKQ